MSTCDITSAIAGPALESLRLDLGGASWELRSFVEGLQIELDGRTAEFVNYRTDAADVVVEVCWGGDFWEPGPVLFDAGPWRAYPHRDGIQFDFFTHLLGPEAYRRAIFNAEFTAGQILLNRRLLGNLGAYYPFEYPLDELASMHRLGRGAGVELHSCGVAIDFRSGFLFVGHSGAGKSTIGKSWVQHRQAPILSDDRVVVTKGGTGYLIHGTPWHGEAGLARNGSAELKGIFLIQHGDRNQAVPLKPTQAATELFARSFVPWYCAEALDFTLAFLQQLAAAVPVYTFQCLPDVSAVEYLEHHHAQ
jgi:hypothetical protein